MDQRIAEPAAAARVTPSATPGEVAALGAELTHGRAGPVLGALAAQVGRALYSSETVTAVEADHARSELRELRMLLNPRRPSRWRR